MQAASYLQTFLISPDPQDRLDRHQGLFELRLSDDIRALSSETRSTVTQARVDESGSGSIGIIPIRIVNLFNNDSHVFRIAVNTDADKDTEFIRQLTDQGGVRITS